MIGTTESEYLIRLDKRQVAVMDEAMTEVLRRKTPAEQLAIGFGLWRSERKLLRGQLASLHPEWDPQQFEREAARRLSRMELYERGLSRAWGENLSPEPACRDGATMGFGTVQQVLE